MSIDPDADPTSGDPTVADVPDRLAGRHSDRATGAPTGAATGAPTGPSTDAPAGGVPALPSSFAQGRYVVTGQLGVGGMGLVLRAEDTSLGRQVAIKLLADNLSADPSARARFLREGRSAAAIADPRVVAVFDVGEEAGRPYLVMELVDGPSFADLVARDGPRPGDEVMTVATDALAGLHRAHEAGLLHRDVKPGNLLCAPDGTTKVTDFGVATAVDEDKLTRTGFVIGTAAYLAPERRRGEPATVRTDLWALGATLTELLTGHPPGEAADAVLAGRGDEVPAQLRHLMGRLLAADPADRPADALAALELLAGDPATSHATTPPAGHAATTLLEARAWTPSPPAARTPDPDRSDPGSDHVRARTDGDGSGTVAGRRSTWPRVALLVVVLAAAAAALWALTGSGQEGTAPDDGFGPVIVDPSDPAGTVRELGEQLRDRAGR